MALFTEWDGTIPDPDDPEFETLMVDLFNFFIGIPAEANAVTAEAFFQVQTSISDTTYGKVQLCGYNADFADLKVNQITAAADAQGSASAILRAPGSLANDGMAAGELVDLVFNHKRSTDGATGTVARIRSIAESDQTSSWPTALAFHVRRFSSDFEAMRIESTGALLVGKSLKDTTSAGIQLDNDGRLTATRDANLCMLLNRKTNDGTMVTFQQDGSDEGSISVSGTTVSYNGAHLSRWSQVDGAILRGTVMSNLDEMCEWRGISYTVPVLMEPARSYVPAVEAQVAVYDDADNLIQAAVEAREEIPAKDAVYRDVEHRVEYFGDALDGTEIEVEHDGETYAGTVYTEANEQLNKMKVSDVVGDRNVAGVFQGWDQDDIYGDMLCAMTGDFVIRIGAGVTVARGDLLMSAGDGTACPQDDDVLRSCTVAKVTSGHVVETYDDGSYLVPCVLMAC